MVSKIPIVDGRCEGTHACGTGLTRGFVYQHTTENIFVV